MTLTFLSASPLFLPPPCFPNLLLFPLVVSPLQGSELISKHVSPPSDKLDSPVLAFIFLERYNAVRLVQAVHSSLAALNKVLRGSSLLTTDVQRLAGSLLKHEVRNTTS